MNMFSSGTVTSTTVTTKADNLAPWPVNTTTAWINQDLTGATVNTG